jgi:hypothetical protein
MFRFFLQILYTGAFFYLLLFYVCDNETKVTSTFLILLSYALKDFFISHCFIFSSRFTVYLPPSFFSSKSMCLLIHSYSFSLYLILLYVVFSSRYFHCNFNCTYYFLLIIQYSFNFREINVQFLISSSQLCWSMIMHIAYILSLVIFVLIHILCHSSCVLISLSLWADKVQSLTYVCVYVTYSVN